MPKNCDCRETHKIAESCLRAGTGAGKRAILELIRHRMLLGFAIVVFAGTLWARSCDV
jgi:hypothetical protein